MPIIETTTCQHCGNPFEHRRRTKTQPERKFCSRRCHADYRSVHPGENFHWKAGDAQQKKNRKPKLSDDLSYRPWEKRPHEAQQSYNQFLDYCEMGEGRSITDYWLKIEKEKGPGTPNRDSLRVIRNLANTQKWEERAFLWDTYTKQKRNEEWVRRQVELDEIDWADGKKLRDRAMSALDAIDFESASVRDVVDVLKLAHTLMRSPMEQRIWTKDSVQQLLEGLPEGIRPKVARIFYAEIEQQQLGPVGTVIDGEVKVIES